MKTFQAVAAAFMASNAVNARLWFGSCPAVDYNSNFNTAAFAGQWYQQESDAIFAYGGDSTCSTGNYVLNSAGNLDVVWRAYYYVSLSGIFNYGSSPPGEMSCDSYDCQVSMGGGSTTTPWGILGTDYDNWHVAYWCGSILGIQYSWLGIYGKQPSLSDAHMDAAYAAVEDKLDGYLMGWPWTKKISQEDCEYEW